LIIPTDDLLFWKKTINFHDEFVGRHQQSSSIPAMNPLFSEDNGQVDSVL
jgi:hypothetical protein